MLVMTRSRRGGKTHAALAWLAEDPGHRVIVTSTVAEALRLHRHAEQHFPLARITRAHFVPWGSRETLRGRRVEVAVDNADMLLQELFGAVGLITLTGSGC